jgi:tetratricopeptide (TPR) repeat protein
MELDSNDTFRILDGRTWAQCRQDLANRDGPPRQVNRVPYSDDAWHRQEATLSEQSNQWFAARWHLDRLIAATPADGSLHAQLAAALERFGRWSEAEADYSRAIELGADRLDPQIRVRRALALEKLFQWSEAEADYDRAIERGVDRRDPQIRARRGAIRIRYKRLAEAAADYSRLVELRPEDHWVWMQSAYAQLQADRRDRYREQGRAMLQRFESASQWDVCDRTAKVCLTVADSPEFIRRAAVLAERACKLQPNNGWVLYCAALADYRTGRYESALARLRRGREALKTTQGGGWPGYPAQSSAVEAMAQVRLGHAREARDALGRAESILTAGLEKGNPSSPSGLDSWTDWVHCRTIVREAQAVVADLGFPADAFAR